MPYNTKETPPIGYNRTTTTAIINGKEEEYDECSENNEFTSKWKAEYLGKGKIHKVNNVLQKGEEEYHFWRKKIEE